MRLSQRAVKKRERDRNGLGGKRTGKGPRDFCNGGDEQKDVKKRPVPC